MYIKPVISVINSLIQNTIMSYTIESVLEAYNKLQKLYKFNYSLKTDQVQAIVNIINKKHSLVVLPTGYGKTDIFMLTPLILDILKPDEKHYALVVVPLLSLMAEMKLKYKDRGVDVVMVTQTQKMEAEELAGIKNGTYPIILVTPEILVDNKHWLDIFVKSPTYQKSIAVVAIDEAHVLVLWGEQFRPSYKILGELRSHFDQTPFAAFTATCSEQIRLQICQILHLTVDEVSITAAIPDRPNIMISYTWTSTRARWS